MRAIHIEKFDSLEADSFINAFVRFCARRGVPEKVRSDNGTTFVEGEKELREAMRNWKAHFCRKRSSGSLIPRQLPIWEGYGKDRSERLERC